MHVLDNVYIKKIAGRITAADVSDESLSIDLLDHICCMIEERLALGYDLKSAEEMVFKELGAVQLKSIEIETKRLTQNKFIMNKRTKIIGLIALMLLMFGAVFKLLHLPGANVLWGIGVLLAAFGFFLVLLIDRFRYQQTNPERISSLIGYIGAATLILGLGLAYLKWPVSVYFAEGGGILLLIYFVLNNTLSLNNENLK